MGCPARGAQPAHEADRLLRRLMGKTLASMYHSGSVDWSELMRARGPYTSNGHYMEYGADLVTDVEGWAGLGNLSRGTRSLLQPGASRRGGAKFS